MKDEWGDEVEAPWPAPAPPTAPARRMYTPPEVRFPGDRYDLTVEDWKAATPPPAPPGVPTKPSKDTPVSGMVLWFEHQIAEAKAKYGSAWAGNKRWVVDYTREEMAAWIGAERADEVVQKAAARVRG